MLLYIATTLETKHTAFNGEHCHHHKTLDINLDLFHKLMVKID